MSSMAPKVLILSSYDDAHIPYVTSHLKSTYIIIESQSIADGDELSYAISQDKAAVTYKGEDLKDVVGVWYRRSRPAEFLRLPIRPEVRKYSASAITQHTEALFTSFPEAVWVSDPFAIHRAECKPHQLWLARSLGFCIPDTLFTSSSKSAKDFVDAHDSTLFKPISRDFPTELDGKKNLGLYTTKIVSPDTLSLAGLNFAPTIFQQTIEAVYDLRVTVVGEKVFAASIAIDESDAGSIRDWRSGIYDNKLTIDSYPLPRDLRTTCVALIKKLGLVFGAIDFVVDAKGTHWFLEVNPNGQWAFIEDKTGQAIGKAIADLLVSKLG